jgi:hypothetical protein
MAGQKRIGVLRHSGARALASEPGISHRPLIKMPNRSMFVGDTRPEVKTPACVTGC